MRNTAVVAWREILEHRAFLVAAVAASLVSLIVPFIPGIFGWSPAEVRGVLTAVMAIGFTTISALTLGASTVAGTVANGRLGFFMARPLSGAAIWLGKVVGILALITVCELIVVLPAALSADGPAFFSDLIGHPWLWSGILIGAPLVMILLAHAASTAWRAPKVWVGIDLLALLIAGVTGWMAVSPLFTVRAELAAAVVVLAMAGAVVVVIVGAGARQVSAGGCDPHRHHQVLSLTMWPALLVLLAVLAGYGRWLTTPGIGDLRWADGGPIVNPSGDWIAVSGQTRGRWDIFATFALNLDSLQSVSLGLGPRWHGTMGAFSGDGRRAAWTVPEGDGWRLRSGAMDSLLTGGGDTAVFMEHQPWMVLSHRGDRLATVEDGTLVVSSLPAGDLAGSVRLPADLKYFGPYFASDNRVGMFVFESTGDVEDPPSVRALEFDLDDRKMVEIGGLPDAGNLFSATLDEQRNRWLLGMVRERHTRWRYVDGRTFSDVPWAREAELGPVVSMLADGRLVRLVNESGSSRLEVLSPEGDLVGEVHLPRRPKRLTIGFQPTPSTLVVAVAEGDLDRSWFDGWDARLVDLESGETRAIGSGIVPAKRWFRRGNVTRPLPTGCAASRLFIGSGSSLWLWDQATGKLEQLVAGRW